jgi:hypothetical protein
MSRSIVATALVVHNPGSASVLGSNGQKPVAQSHALRGGPMCCSSFRARAAAA